GRQERQRFVGSIRPVLFEGQGQPVEDRPECLLWSGHTDNYLRVLVHAPVGMDLHNRLAHTYLEALHGDTLLGTLEPEPLSSDRRPPISLQGISLSARSISAGDS